jgi:hypothetical protein
VADCRGVTQITARALFCGGNLAVEQMLSAED